MDRILAVESLRPANSKWVPITDELLRSSAFDEWDDLVKRFDAVRHEAGQKMANWLRDAVSKQSIALETHAIRTSSELLGFYSVRPAFVAFTDSERVQLELRRKDLRTESAHAARADQRGLMLASIVRAKSTDRGFGRVLVGHAVGLALQDDENKAIFVKPANERVSDMWREAYSFRPMDVPTEQLPHLLWFPVNVPLQATWP
jgi:hypothetical protein